MLELLLLSHSIGDFLLQSDKTANQKNEFVLVGYIKHFVCLMVTSMIICFSFYFSSGYNAKPFIIAWISAISVIHIIIDYLKSLICSHINNKNFKFQGFLIDQLLHIGIIYFIFKNDSLYNSEYYKYIFIAFIFIMVIFGGDCLIRSLMDMAVSKGIASKEKEVETVGSIIGRLERFIILAGVLLNQWSVLAVVVAMKSIVRYKDIEKSEDKLNSDYVILGSIASLTIVLVGYFIISQSLR